jgi:hypothetical protein
MRRREFIAGLGSAAAWPVMFADTRRNWTLAPDVITAQHLDRDAVAAGDSHLLSRNEWTGGDV